MSDLSELLVTKTDVQLSTINLARYRYPELSLIESIIQCQGEAQARLIQLVAKTLKLSVLTGHELHNIDESLYVRGGVALQQLVITYKSLPIRIVMNDSGGGSKLLLAMTNPLDQQAKQVFAEFFQIPLELFMVRETELFEALRYTIARSPEIINHLDSTKRQPTPKTNTIVEPSVAPQLQQVIEAALSYGATGIEFEFKGGSCQATMVASDSRVQSVEMTVNPEALVTQLLQVAAVTRQPDGRLVGAIHFELADLAVEARVTFDHAFRNRRGVDAKALILSNVTVNQSRFPDFWASAPGAVSEQIAAMVARNAGIYVGVFSQNESFQRTVVALRSMCPDLVVVNGFDVLLQDLEQLTANRHSRIFVPHRAKGIPEAMNDLLSLPDPVRNQIAGFLSHTRLARSCPLCREQTAPTADTIALFPQSIAGSITQLWYPRGCPICAGSGYLGSLGISAMQRMDSPAGELFRRKEPADVIRQQMTRDGFVSPVQVILQEAIAGNTTVELAATAISPQAKIAPERLTARGRQIFRNNKPIADAGEPTTESPIFIAIKRGTEMGDFHSMVLQLGEDALGMRASLIAEEQQKQAQAAAPAKPKLGSGFHSVVLDLGQDERKMRENLLAEQHDQALETAPPSPSPVQPAAKKPNPSGNLYHSMVIGLDDDMNEMRKKLLEED